MRQIIIICGLIFILGNSSCSLDYENTGAITPDNVWQDKTMISAFLTDIYGRMLPGWPVNANNTDEGMNGPRDMSSYARGQITVDNQGQGFDYSKIDRINFFLDKIQSTTVLTEVEKKQLKGQALFWRAWDYWGKVFSLGGVPLILTPQDMTDTESLFVPRNTTTECVTQILADLDEAIACLPDTWEGEDYGRIDKGCAMAFKGRVLLQYASPLFNPDNNRQRWQNAYDANLEAVNFLKSVGKGLYEGNFADIWYDEQNKEVIMVNQFYYPDHKFSQASIRPEPLSGGAANANEAILPLLLAYPKIDGTPLELDIDRLATDASYNEQFMTEFYVDRDPRFYATIFCPGTEYPCSDRLIDGAKYWNAWKLLPNEESETGYQYVTLIFDQLSQGVGKGSTGYFQKKGLDYDLTSANREDADVDWIEIRFAEVLMNMGEAANEIGKTDEALQVLYDIRKRAGIQSTDGKYGITAMSQDEIREAYINERFIEFAYEGKRFNDLRRWKRYDILNNLKYRSCLYPVIKDVNNLASFDWTKDMYDPEVRKLFRFDYIECADFDMQYVFNLDLNHWFYPIKKDDLDRNSKLEQNNEWGGTFDPLK
ncbi:RagB/SusD family nutrient uptake outer membrane protein [Phocaeicola barnesiae]|uniref:RagB/SusD family nutrient uptake outer membrane protein n=1 Tax=Phocaeicola barnesiae TaxID=376804 RepID=A0AAW5N5E2_9BACT|nr:RagB/SusD family nutrient uptake outer membrane protein [Phocaeicola barnesiae]MCR8873050.1 RagB/SusD family nutrient uptake outer membrane protein [Phocaeicola barnesiae]